MPSSVPQEEDDPDVEMKEAMDVEGECGSPVNEAKKKRAPSESKDDDDEPDAEDARMSAADNHDDGEDAEDDEKDDEDVEFEDDDDEEDKDDDEEDLGEEFEEEEEPAVGRRRSQRGGGSASASSNETGSRRGKGRAAKQAAKGDDDGDEDEEDGGGGRRLRTSKRTNKFTASMAEPSSTSIRDLLQQGGTSSGGAGGGGSKSNNKKKGAGAAAGSRKQPARTAVRNRSASYDLSEGDDDFMEEEDEEAYGSTKTNGNKKKKSAASTKPRSGGRTAATAARSSRRTASAGSSLMNAAGANDGEGSPYKSPVRRHTRARRKSKVASAATTNTSASSGSSDERDSSSSEEDDDDDASGASSSASESTVGSKKKKATVGGRGGREEEPLKIQRILACRSEKRCTWRRICRAMQTSEVDFGSRWHQDDRRDVPSPVKKSGPADGDADGNENVIVTETNNETESETITTTNNNNNNTNGANNKDDDVYEERFLVKWKDFSYLHCSWETQKDLELQIEGARVYFNTFFKKSENGILLSSDERCDGDYYDPAYKTVDRILEVVVSPGDPALTVENEDTLTPSDWDIVTDRDDPEYDEGTGRQFLVKWGSMPHSEASYEFERDLVLADIEYREHVRAFIVRNTKPSRSDRQKAFGAGESERRRLYKIFGDNSRIEQSVKDEEVAMYQKELEDREYKNGGQLRDYQAEGVSWMISNFCNDRSVILADEMGLGKTLQTAATVKLWLTNYQQNSNPVLIIAPLSTLAHWKREFEAWTDLNTIIYHGSAEDRRLIREHEFVYECDRPEGNLAFNQTYLKKCIGGRKKKAAGESPWMVQVVITTPEMVVCEDSAELAAVPWEVLVVDEAHRLKNNNSKLTIQLKGNKFSFDNQILLTGTPIQNNVQEFWTLLNFIDPDSFDDSDEFMEKYGDLKSKETMDQLHEEIRPYILRRLKEDVEKSVPPKEETLIEVELTISQKQYYRALYEKNVTFLRKNKRALDGPSLNNLAMELRKCCNHLFLLKGVEEDFRKEREQAGENLSEGELLVKASGKLVLLDKLLPRLREQGHRVLLFSQFKIMLDVLEDYLCTREMKFERIDGSITGNKRQQAIDRFQAPSAEGKELPFIMLLSTRAGGVGINLTAADTVLIFDSDFNPQNDLQAQARCHRIGQTKSVNVYRLLTRKTYEMQLFHMSSLKMGLDQAVLKGFESGGSGEGALSKSEVEKLLRHGAYDIFNEDKAGAAEAESKDFVEQDIDSILERRSRTVVHENTGSKSSAAGGTFSKASFKAAKSPAKANGPSEDVDIEDPDFWKKMLGDPVVAEGSDILSQPRRRTKTTNYAESAFTSNLDAQIFSSDSDAEASSDESDGDDDDGNDNGSKERCRWGGSADKNEWLKDDAESVTKSLLTFGFGIRPWDDVLKLLELPGSYSTDEVKRMFFSVGLLTILETVDEEVAVTLKKLRQEAADNKATDEQRTDGGVLGQSISSEELKSKPALFKKMFDKLWGANASWAKRALEDGVAFANSHEPRDKDAIERSLRPKEWKPQPDQSAEIEEKFSIAWQSLQNRGWKSQSQTSGSNTGKTRYEYDGKQYWSYESVLRAAKVHHPDLAPMCDSVLDIKDANRKQSLEIEEKEKSEDLSLKADNIDSIRLRRFLERYSPLQLLFDRKKARKQLKLGRKILSTCAILDNADLLVRRADARSGDAEAVERLTASLSTHKTSSALPHPMWTPRHDAILVHAITKHGWIDQDSRLRAIAEDPAIRWGAPFEADKEQSSGKAEAAKEELQQDAEELRTAAFRAAQFLNANKDLVEEFKGFDKMAVKQAYCLTRQAPASEASDSLPVGSPSGQSPASQTLQVDEEALLGSGSGATGTKGQCRPEPVDLPTTKELHKRAKCLLFRKLSNTGAPNKSSPAAHGFSALDPSARCNVLLAEMFRGLLKAPSTGKDKMPNKQNRKLCGLVYEEVCQRSKDMKALLARSPELADDLSKSLSAMDDISKHVLLLQRNLMKHRQYKNVIRVILGDDPHQGRTPDEPLFPSLPQEPQKRAFPSLHTAHTKPSKALNPEASGDLAIEAARRMLSSRTERENGQISSENAAAFLDLTEVEVLILSVSCSSGLPVWKKDGRTGGSSNSYAWSWASFARSVASLAQELYQLEKENFSKAQKQEGSKEGAKSEELLWNAERMYSMKERASEQAADYALEPDTLAKKTIMMVAKMLKYSKTSPSNSHSPNGLQLGPGSKEMTWLDSNIQRWASSLDLLDSSGCPLAFTAIDFIDDLPDRSSIEVSAIMDKKGCRGVMSQVCVVTRLRAVFVTNAGPKTKSMLDKAAKAMAAAGHEWDSQPVWWGPDHGVGRKNMTFHDRLLLERLLHNGFTKVLDDTKDYGLSQVAAAKTPFKDNELTKEAIQSRATQLARALHTLEIPDNSTFRVLEEVGQKRTNNKASSPTVARPKAKKASVQTGLSNYFNVQAGAGAGGGAGGGGGGNNNVGQKSAAGPAESDEDDDDDEVQVIDIPQQRSNKPANVEAIDSDSDVEIISPRKAAAAASGSKRKDDGKSSSDESAGSTEKKMRKS